MRNSVYAAWIVALAALDLLAYKTGSMFLLALAFAITVIFVLSVDRREGYSPQHSTSK